VLVKIKKVGFCGSDLKTFRGQNPIVDYPRIPGHEIAAVVAGIGETEPAGFQVGDKVLVLPYTNCGSCWSCLNNRPNACKNNQTLGVQQDGGMTEFLAVPHTKLIGNVNDLSFSEIAIVEPLAVGFHAASRAEAHKDETMLVFGCGMVGLGAIAKGNVEGATVIAVDIDDDKLELARQFGATHVINSQSQNLKTEVLRLTDGHGVAVTVEAIGLKQTFVAAVDLTAFAGRVVYVGYVKDPVLFETKEFVIKEIQIRGARNAVRQDFVDVLEVMKDLDLPIDKLISKDVSLAEAGETLRYWSENTTEITKILVSFE
jgi:threonine dehydrogenase-like Zn-dependent dehydrogenase